MDPARRNFLRGAPPPPPAGAGLVAQIAPVCLAHQRVECRVCGEACEAGAIRFAPQRGGVSLPQVVTPRCTGCGACVAPCPVHAIGLAPLPAAAAAQRNPRS